MISEHTTHFGGKPVREWDHNKPIDPAINYRIAIDYDQASHGTRWTDRFAGFLSDPDASRITGLVVGDWGQTARLGEEGSESIVQALVAIRHRLPDLTAIFLGDIISEENEISWIRQSDLSPLLHAYPNLEHLWVRGNEGLSLGTLQHEKLKSLVIQTGGLSVNVVRQVTSAKLPELEHLELWLGDENYGGDATLEDVIPILYGTLFPKLKYLGLCNSEFQDEIAQAVAQSPILEQLEVLDMSKGTLSDEGAAALLGNPALRKLKELDLHHHYCSDEMVDRLKELGIDVDLSEQQDPDDDDGHRYVAVSE
jgi:hypothetical protein